MSEELAWLSIAELGARLKKREVSCVEVVKACIERTQRVESRLNTYITFLPERALEDARKLDRELKQSAPRSALHGVPLSLKDLFDTEGIATTAGAHSLKTNVATKDAAVARRLKQAGAVLLGKSNMNKFAEGESGDNPDTGKIRNPWNPEFSAGGSSGGSAAQVASGMAALSVGSDNGGSIRNPAALCGIVGFKPTHGRVSMEGMFPRVYTFDHAGPLTRTVLDCAIALQILAGHTPGDTTTLRKPVPSYLEKLSAPLNGLKIGVDRTLTSLGEPAVLSAFEVALKTLGSLGASLQEVALPSVEEMGAVLYTLFYVEWAAVHEPWLRQRPQDYGMGSRAALLIPAVDYVSAARKRRSIQIAYARATRGVELVASPTYPLERRPFTGFPRVQGKRFTADDALRYTLPFDVLGLPAISIPCGFSERGFPLGLQLAGRAFDEATVLRAAYAYEHATEWHRRRPPV